MTRSNPKMREYYDTQKIYINIKILLKKDTET